MHGADAAGEVLHADRLDHEVIGSDAMTGLLGAIGRDDHAAIAGGGEPLHQHRPGIVRQAEIDQHNVGPETRLARDRFARGFRKVGGHAGGVQAGLQRDRDGGRVLDDEDAQARRIPVCRGCRHADRIVAWERRRCQSEFTTLACPPVAAIRFQ